MKLLPIRLLHKKSNSPDYIGNLDLRIMLKDILKCVVNFHNRSQSNRDVLFSIFFMCLGIYLFTLASEFPEFKTEKFGPAFYPKILSGLFILVSLLIFLRNIRLVQYGNDEKTIKTPGSLISVFFAVFMAVFLVLSIEKIGFIISTTIFLLFLMEFLSWRTKGFGIKNFIFIAIISVCTSVSIWLIFSVVMKVMLPAGTLIY